MPVKVRVPTPLQKITQNQPEVETSGKTVRELIDNLEKTYPGLKDRICDQNGKLRRFVNVYVNEEDIRFLKNEETPVKDGDEVSIIPAIAGGCEAVIASPAQRAGRSNLAFPKGAPHA